ncbi:hypothetical protein FHW96_004903 [Novosphingobium sp. SG751A]|uniref:DUF2971 domain-containing protein n=1 Tax=Novosphingobium sp. SG751A TaxID=2587000 RepID=UPI001553A058|nr:DUF2971 domain-containing protein [Novosphingobium sp. SG751A]NOW48713.1 hypothetical protein [Novosphingobium sp. SG751A]
MADETKLKRYTTLASAVDMLVNERLALLDPSKWKDTNDTHFLGAFQDSVKAKSIYAACFTQAAETYHHWQVFAGENEGVCVEIDKEALLGSLVEQRAYMWDDMKYRTLQQLERRRQINAYELPFLKRKGFSDEKEFRLLYHSSRPQKSVHVVPIKRRWIKRIILNPWINDALFESMRTALKSIPGCGNVSVIHTSLINNAEWKDACEKVTELQTVRRPLSRSVR